MKVKRFPWACWFVGHDWETFWYNEMGFYFAFKKCHYCNRIRNKRY